RDALRAARREKPAERHARDRIAWPHSHGGVVERLRALQPSALEQRVGHTNGLPARRARECNERDEHAPHGFPTDKAARTSTSGSSSTAAGGLANGIRAGEAGAPKRDISIVARCCTPAESTAATVSAI